MSILDHIADHQHRAAARQMLDQAICEFSETATHSDIDLSAKAARALRDLNEALK